MKSPDSLCKKGHDPDWYIAPNGYATCRECRRESVAAHAAKYPDKVKEQNKRSYMKHQEKRRAYDKIRNSDPKRIESLKEKNLRSRYGIGLTEVNEKVLAQDSQCKICGDELVNGKGGKAVDHDYVTGGVRDILCSPCNKGLGHFRDDVTIMSKAIQYLEYWNAQREIPR